MVTLVAPKVMPPSINASNRPLIVPALVEMDEKTVSLISRES